MTGGDAIVLGKLAPYERLYSGQRVATDIETSDSTPWGGAAEVVVQSVTGVLRDNATYRIHWYANIQGSVAGDVFFYRIREDSVSGTVLSLRAQRIHQAGGNTPYQDEVEYTATADGSKTFAIAAIRSTGTGLGTRIGSTSSRCYLYIDYIRG